MVSQTRLVVREHSLFEGGRVGSICIIVIDYIENGVIVIIIE